MASSPQTQTAIVPIELCGDRVADLERVETLLRRRLGDETWRRPRGTVWHDPGDGTLQLVPVLVHAATPHAGSEAYPAQAPEPKGTAGIASPGPLAGPLPGPPPGLLEAVEETLELRLPKSYRNFLRRHNGGVPRRPVFTTPEGRRESIAAFLGFAPEEEESVFTFLQLYATRLPAGTLPIAYDPFGNLLLLDVSDTAGPVWLWLHENEPDAGGHEENAVLPVAASFAAFLRSFES